MAKYKLKDLSKEADEIVELYLSSDMIHSKYWNAGTRAFSIKLDYDDPRIIEFLVDWVQYFMDNDKRVFEVDVYFHDGKLVIETED